MYADIGTVAATNMQEGFPHTNIHVYMHTCIHTHMHTHVSILKNLYRIVAMLIV